VSLSIGPSPAVPPLDGAAGDTSPQKIDPSAPPFEAILDGHTDANDEESVNLGEPALPIDFVSEPAPTVAPGAVQSAIDRLAGLLRGFGIRKRLTGQDEISQDVKLPQPIAKARSVHDTAAFALLAPDVLQRFAPLQVQEVPQEHASGVVNAPTAPADEMLAQDLLAALIEIDSRAAAADQGSVPTTADALPLRVDSLSSESTADAQPTQEHAPDLSVARPLVQTSAQAADAVGLSTNQEVSADQDKGLGRPAAPEVDRRSTTGSTVVAFHPTEAVTAVETTPAANPSSTVATVPLPNAEGVASSIVQTMRLQMRDGIGIAVVHLEPDYLGAVSIALRVENGVVTASFHAENPQVRAWTEANEPLLRESLAAQGLTLDRLVVTDNPISDERPSDRRDHQEPKQEGHAPPRPRRDDATTFEVVV
jgi:hypothetical protein